MNEKDQGAEGHRHHHHHDHDHHHGHHHGHDHDHDHHHHSHHDDPGPGRKAGDSVLVIRPNSGLSGDMILAGLIRLADLDQTGIDEMVRGIGSAPLLGSVGLERRSVNAVGGWFCRVELPEDHTARNLADILALIDASAMTERAALLAKRVFTDLAEAEARVHDVPAMDVTFHEVGALDSILDICLAAALYDRLGPDAVVCGPLPLCDGVVRCAHGIVPAPAPAVLELLDGIPVRGIASEGETVTPTAIALLRGFKAEFGPWPAMTVERKALVYGGRILPGIANGAIFAWGRAGR